MVTRVAKCTGGNFSKMIFPPLFSGIAMLLSIFCLKSVVSGGILGTLLLVAVGILVYLGIVYLLDRFLNYGIGVLIKESITSFRGV